MANTTKTKTPTTVKNETRVLAFNAMVEAFTAIYGEDKVFRIGDTEIAVCVNTAPTGEPIYAVYSPTIKDYCDRQTPTKTVKAFDVTEAVEKHKNTVAERDKKAAVALANKTIKKAQDEARREANAKARAKAKAKKANSTVKIETLTEFKERILDNVNVKVKT